MKTKKSRPRDPLHFLMLGFRDYVAARTLLLDDQLITGATFASTAIEKYLKAVLTVRKARINMHLDELPKFRRVFTEHDLNLLDELDQMFLEVLSKAFKLRYYDTLGKFHFGFFKWQLLCELDCTVALIEERIKVSGGAIPSPYRRAVADQTASVCKENQLFANVTKQEFMERPGPVVWFHFDPDYGQLAIQHRSLEVEYHGQLASVREFKVDGKEAQIKFSSPMKQRGPIPDEGFTLETDPRIHPMTPMTGIIGTSSLEQEQKDKET